MEIRFSDDEFTEVTLMAAAVRHYERGIVKIRSALISPLRYREMLARLLKYERHTRGQDNDPGDEDVQPWFVLNTPVGPLRIEEDADCPHAIGWVS